MPGASGALEQGGVHAPFRTGELMDVNDCDIDRAIERAVAKGATILFAKTHMGADGYVAEISDSEGDRSA